MKEEKSSRELEDEGKFKCGPKWCQKRINLGAWPWLGFKKVWPDLELESQNLGSIHDLTISTKGSWICCVYFFLLFNCHGR